MTFTTPKNEAYVKATSTAAQVSSPSVQPNGSHTIINAQHISQSFVSDKGTELKVLRDISFTLNEGEIVAILGRSGAGKSTLLRVLSGLVKPTQGSVQYRGKELRGPNPSIAFIFQTFALMPWLTVQDNVELGLQAQGVPRAERTKLALEAIDSIGLDGFESAYPKELSGGMRQRVGIARSLVRHPDALLMDEPFSALDVLTAENLRQEVLDLWSGDRSGIRSILIVTHNIEEAVQMADRVVVLGPNPGHVIAQVPIDLPRPRDKHAAQFEATVDQLYAILTGQEPKATSDTSTTLRTETREESKNQTTQPAQNDVYQGVDNHTNTDVNSSVNIDSNSDIIDSSEFHEFDEEATDGATLDLPLLPEATPGGLAGLLEVIAQYPQGVDLADLASDLSFEVDDLFPLVDAGLMLGVITATDGHVNITESGKAWQNADILESKTIFSQLAMQHAPFIRTIEAALRKARNGHLRGELIVDLLGSKYAHEQAKQQFDIAVEWGRYAELFDYDADDDMLFLDTETE